MSILSLGDKMGHYVYVKNKKTKAGELGHWPEKKKTEALLTYLSTGSVAQTVAITGVPRNTLSKWKMSEWWKTSLQQILDEDDFELSAKYQKIIKKALEVSEDRLTNGNFQFDQRTGKIIRIPVSLKETNTTIRTLSDQRQMLLNKTSVEHVRQETVNDKLIKLASQFAEMAMKNKKEKEVTGETYEHEASWIQEGSIEDSTTTGSVETGSGSNSGQCDTECVSESKEEESTTKES